jgi:hypothetical protein
MPDKFFLIIFLILTALNSIELTEGSIFPQVSEFDSSTSVHLPGCVTGPYFDEQICMFNYEPGVRILINAPTADIFDRNKPTEIVLFALPNENTIEQTVGKQLNPGDDWHYDIQHIGAQTRFLRNQSGGTNLVVVYLETSQKSWPFWKSKHPEYPTLINSIVDYLTELFSEYNPCVVLTGHSGGGGFIFGFLDSVDEIPSNINRISFLDSNYGYDDTYGPQLLNWINDSDEHFLSVIAYNDSAALYNGKPVVSASGGTWYRSKVMKDFLDDHFEFEELEDDEFIKHTALDDRIKFILKKNPDKLILHTVQVELNGFIQGLVSGTSLENDGYNYYGQRVYSEFIQDAKILPRILMIPPRPVNALTGSQFMQKIMDLTFEQRETEIYKQISMGNIPEFLRSLTKITSEFKDADGIHHVCTYEVMPDYLAIGSDSDFCRIPMGPVTAQQLANLFGAVLPTSKLVDSIYENALVKLKPVPFAPVGNENTLVKKFVEHNKVIENQRSESGGVLGQLVGGIKKDVVLSNKIFDPTKQNRVVIYGWHQLSGVPIQPLTNVHINSYVDYSHGIRLLNQEMILDGETVNIKSILTDPILFKAISDEAEKMYRAGYLID